MAKKATRANRPLGVILPALVFGLGIAALWTGIPKEIAAHRLSSSGVKTIGKIMAIEHTNKKQILSLDYLVKGKDYIYVSEQDDASIPPGGHPNTEVVYSPDDPSVATTNLAGDTKLANEYVLAGLLELVVGGWFSYSAVRQRRVALLKAVAEKKARSSG